MAAHIESKEEKAPIQIKCEPAFTTKPIPMSTRQFVVDNFIVVGVDVYDNGSIQSIGLYSETGHITSINYTNGTRYTPTLKSEMIKKDVNVTEGKQVTEALRKYIAGVLGTTTNKGIIFVAYNGTEMVFPVLIYYLQDTIYWNRRQLYACDVSDLHVFCSSIVKNRFEKYDHKVDGSYPFESLYGMIFNCVTSSENLPVDMALSTLRLAMAMAWRLGVNKHASDTVDDVIWQTLEAGGKYEELAKTFKAFCYETIHELGQTWRRIPTGASSGFILPYIYYNSTAKSIEVKSETTHHRPWFMERDICMFTGLAMLDKVSPANPIFASGDKWCKLYSIRYNKATRV
jgi:hypothetical protein